MEVILDTNGLSAWLDGDEELKLRLIAVAGVWLSTIVLGEYRFGIKASRHREVYERKLSELAMDIPTLTEVLGIIGRNGAGKSTLLKILSRVTCQTEGRIKVHPGGLGSRLGDCRTGSPKGETNGSERINMFSSGMYVRLAFAVAAHLEPEPERLAAWRTAAASRPEGLLRSGEREPNFDRGRGSGLRGCGVPKKMPGQNEGSRWPRPNEVDNRYPAWLL